MLQFIKIRDPQHIQEILKRYNPLKHTWIVSDLKSKQEIQSEAVKRYGYFTDDSIMRVSDFWRLWMRRLDPRTQVVSADFIRVLVQNFVEKHGEELDLQVSESSTLANAIQEFAPLLLHPESRELMSEWLSEDYKRQSKLKKWQRWYQLADIALHYIVGTHRIIDSKWSAAHLQSVDLTHFKWERAIYIDLGSELSPVELGLFKMLSQHQDVIVLVPEPEWKSQFPFLMKVYDSYLGYGEVIKLDEPVKSEIDPDQFVRLNTQLAEVKFAVAQCRRWADAGVPLDQMAVIAADIENYWPALQMHLDEEGLRYRKDTVASLNSLGDIQAFMALLQSYSQDVSWESLEKSLFSKNQRTQFKFEKFKSLFYQLYDEDDLGRESKVKNLYFKKVDFTADIDRDDFLALMVRIWMETPHSHTKEDLFETVFKDILAQSLNVRLRTSDWVQFLKNRLARKEVTLKRASENGIHTISLMSAHMLNLQHKVYIGLNDEFFRQKRSHLMNPLDAQRIQDDLGLNIDVSEESYLDFNLRWQASHSTKQTFFTTAHLGFSAEPLNAHLFFIENRPQSGVEVPARTRLDELQLSLARLPEDFQSSQVSTERLISDMKGYSVQISSPVFRQLSVGDLENYAQCSFKLLSSKGFKLRDYAQVALDLDPRDKGNLVHALFEFLIHDLTTQSYSVERTNVFLDQQRNERKLYINLETVWSVQKNRFLQMAERFVAFEKERARLFKSETEKSLQVFFDLKTKKFTAEEPQNGFLFKLRADRIDTHRTKKYSVVYDYKSSAGSERNPDKWLSEYQFQMLLYLISLKLHLADGLSVKGAMYYAYKNFEIKVGLIDREIGQSDFALNTRNASLYEEEKWQELDTEFTELVAKLLDQLDRGHFAPVPHELEVCRDCDWRRLCRAVHLN